MSDGKEILAAVLALERSDADRIRSLGDLREFLFEEPVVRQLEAAALVEKSVRVRRVMFDALLRVDATRARLVDCFAAFAVDPEPDFRRAAIERLGESGEGEPLIAETLGCDLDEGVQQACLEALLRVVRKHPRTVDAILAYGRTAPAALRPLYVGLCLQLDPAPAQVGLAALLHPWEDAALAARVLDELAKFPFLDAAPLRAYLALETRGDLRARALRAVLAAKDVDPALLMEVLRRLEQRPDEAWLVEAFRNRLTAAPGLVERLAKLVFASPSSRLKLRILGLLEEADVPDLYVRAMGDASPWVRAAAIGWCRRHFAKHATAVAGAFAKHIAVEPIVSLRHEMIAAFLEGGRKGPDIERFLVEWFERETDPRIEETLAAALTGVALTDGNRAALLRAYRKVLVEPFFGDGTKAAVTQRLRSFAYRDEPELAACLRALLDGETRIEMVEELHEQLRKLDTDLDGLAPSLLKLLYRFIQHYPRDPLHGWMKDFKELAGRREDVRAQIPYIVRLTGATWIFEGAGTEARKKQFLPTFLAAVEKGAFRGPQNLLDEAWETRTLRKSDLIAILGRLLDCPGQDGLLQHVFGIMAKAELVTPELVDRCLGYLVTRANTTSTYEVRRYLEKMGRKELGFRERVLAAFTQANYDRYQRTSGGPRDIEHPPRTWNDWEYHAWRLMHHGWPVAELLFELEAEEDVERLIAAPPDPKVRPERSIQYLLLDRTWRKHGEPRESLMRALGTLMRNASKSKSLEGLHDRASMLFWRRWRDFEDKLEGMPVPRDLAEMAAEAYLVACDRHRRFKEKEREKFPEPLKGMDVRHLERLWPYGSAPWKELYEKLEVSSEDEEREAGELFRRAAEDANADRREKAVERLEVLLSSYKHTRFVKARLRQIKATLAKLA